MRGIEAIVTNFSGAFPDTLGINSSGPSTKDGTELIANLFNDYIGVFPQALLNEMGLTPNGNAETSTDSQQMMALIGMMQRYGSSYGCIGSADTDTLHDVQISVGQVPDSTRAYTLRLTSAIAKQGDVAWAAGGTPGTPAGGLMGGTWSANTEYGVYLIYNPTTKVTDAGFSVYTGAGVPTFLPAGFTVYQMVDWVKTDGSSQIIQTITEDVGSGRVHKSIDVPLADINLFDTLGTTRRTSDTLFVPTGYKINAEIRYYITDASAGYVVVITDPDTSDQNPATANNRTLGNASGFVSIGKIMVTTDILGAIGLRASISTVDTVTITTEGFFWKRF